METKQHIQDCQGCRDFAETMGLLVPARMPEPAPALDAAVLNAALGHQTEEQPPASKTATPRWHLHPPAWRWATAAAAALVLMLFAITLLRPKQNAQIAEQPSDTSPESPLAESATTGVTGDELDEEFMWLETQLLAFATTNEREDGTDAPDADQTLMTLEANLLYAEESI